MTNYNHTEIEAKWQEKWGTDDLYRSKVDWSKPKHYALTMLPYPSGDLHIGHWFAMTPSDARARFMRMRGYNVLFPMGFDAFGLPAENAAVQRNIHPAKWTYANIERMRKQLKSMGAMFDWKREAVSCSPSYYHWTEWFFKRFHDGNLAYRGEALVNWSPALQTVLANEQVIDGKDERLGQPVIQKMMSQWFFRITEYAEELLDYSLLNWPESVILMQQNWIGRSQGARVTFKTESGEDDIVVFTTRPDTLWGATFMVLSPEHPLVDKLTTDEQREAIETYKVVAAKTSEIDRMSDTREKTGVFTGGYAINPVNGAKVPVWIADYVLITYGTGAIMAVPAHDERDFAFAKKYDLDIVEVIRMPGREDSDGSLEEAYASKTEGHLVNSAQFNGTPVKEAIGKVIDWLEAEGTGERSINYRLRDWLISRQRYWGAPIPMLYKEDGTIEPVQENNLPVTLPDDVDFLPTGRSPLTLDERFLNATDSDGNPARRETDTMDTFMCSSWYQYRYLSPDYDQGPFDPEEAAYWLPVDVYTGGAEHATMHLLYTRFFNKAMRDLGMFDEAIKIMETNGRSTDRAFDEPMIMLRNQGQILGEERTGDFIMARGEHKDGKFYANTVTVGSSDKVPADFAGVAGELMGRTENILRVDAGGDDVQIVELVEGGTVEVPAIEGANTVNQLKHHLEIQRMSKSKGNVVNPDELVDAYGSDTVRGYMMFAFDWTKGGPWNSQGILGFSRFINDVWDLAQVEYAPKKEADKATRDLRRQTHQTIEKTTRYMEGFSFNTAVAALMSLRNTLKDASKKASASKEAWDEAIDSLLLMLAPISPHVTEELWERRGRAYSIHQQDWPTFDPEVAKEEALTLVVQINGKVRDKIDTAAGQSDEALKEIALASEKVQGWLEGKELRKVIVIKGRLVNIVI